MDQRLSRRRAAFLASTIFLAGFCALTCGSANADDKQAEIPPPEKGVHHQGRSNKKVQSRASDGQGIQEVKKPPEMPGVPLPSSKFMWGFDNPSRSGRNMGARYQVPDSPQSVINHYRELLKGSGWKVLDEASSDKRVFATNDRYRAAVTVAIMGNTKTGGCEVDFTYGCPR